jgi:dTDP-4-amino-4,6-dideoxygalactose transaminase
MGKLIPFNVPYVPEASKRYVLEALESNHQQGDGPFTAKASKMVSDLVGGGHVLLTPSCTHALEMASMLANIGPGDEVILPSYTFTSAATAVTKFGATPVFVDVDMQTKGIDVNQVRDAITPRTKAISWVNYAGIAPDIEGLQSLAKESNLLLIEDNAHGLGGSYKGKPLGSFGDFATQSFHATKNIQCGEGGALVINNSKYIERAEIIREKGTDRSRFVRGEVQKYQWIGSGSSYLIAESLAAILVGQLEEFELIQQHRSETHRQYFELFSTLQRERSNFILPISSKFYHSTHHMFELVLDRTETASFAIEEYFGFEIDVRYHYQSLHRSKAGEKYPYFGGDQSVSERLSGNLIRLPIWHHLSQEQTETVLYASRKIFEKI